MHVNEKRNKKRWNLLLDAVRPVLAYVSRAGVREDREGPLCRPITPDVGRLVSRLDHSGDEAMPGTDLETDPR